MVCRSSLISSPSRWDLISAGGLEKRGELTCLTSNSHGTHSHTRHASLFDWCNHSIPSYGTVRFLAPGTVFGTLQSLRHKHGNAMSLPLSEEIAVLQRGWGEV